MESIEIDKLSPLAVQLLSKHLDRGECEEGSWREFAGYAYGATFQDILETESRRGSPTETVLNFWFENGSNLNVGHLVRILEKIGRHHAVKELHHLFQDKLLAASGRKQKVHQAELQLHQSSVASSSLRVCPSLPTDKLLAASGRKQKVHQAEFPLFSPSLPTGMTLFLSFSGSMVKHIDRFVNCLQKATSYTVELDQRKSSDCFSHQAKLKNKFKHAHFVICFIDEDYVMEAERRITKPDYMPTNTGLIVQLMSDEFQEMGINQRFLPYMLDTNIAKVFPTYLANPPLEPYEHFKNILANELKEVQQMLKMRPVRIERRFYHNYSDYRQLNQKTTTLKVPTTVITQDCKKQKKFKWKKFGKNQKKQQTCQARTTNLIIVKKTR